MEILLTLLVTLAKPERNAFIFKALAQIIVNSMLIFAYVIVCSFFLVDSTPFNLRCHKYRGQSRKTNYENSKIHSIHVKEKRTVSETIQRLEKSSLQVITIL